VSRRTPRSWLYVPGHRADLVAKALAGDADAVVVDLQDAVPPGEKERAREVVGGLRRTSDGPALWVRVNDPAHPTWRPEDLAAAGAWDVDGLRVPRAEDPADLAAAFAGLDLPLQLLVETARGLLALSELARAHPEICGLGLGEADLAADLRVPDDAGLAWARGAVVVASSAAGLPAPVQSVYTAVGDLEGLRAISELGRRLGFRGRSVVHPRQVAVVHEAYTPGTHEVDEAARIVALYDAALADGQAAFVDERGAFVDAAVVERARSVLDTAR
jgi:citrate lyase subunit beta / citryl-CoA lyase